MRIWTRTHSTAPVKTRLRFAVLFMVWIAALLFINWEPFNFHTADWRKRFHGVNWLPFADYYAGNYLQSFDEITQKTVLFVPFGLLLHSAAPSRFDGIHIAASALLFAIIVEIGQIFLAAHHPGVSDLIIETFGAWVGCIISRRIRVLTSRPHANEVHHGRAFAN